MPITITRMNSAVRMTLLAVVATYATVSVRAQQPTPAPAAPTTGVVNVPKLAPVAPARPVYPQPVYPQAAQPVPPQAARPAYQPTVYPQPAAPAGDPYGFTAWLNSTRARYGLPAVGYDPNLTNWASMNNSQQAARGMGHYVMGPARRQNSAMGQYASIGAMWMASPAHRAALLDPTIRSIGIAGMGMYWTFNAN